MSKIEAAGPFAGSPEKKPAPPGLPDRNELDGYFREAWEMFDGDFDDPWVLVSMVMHGIERDLRMFEPGNRPTAWQRKRLLDLLNEALIAYARTWLEVAQLRNTKGRTPAEAETAHRMADKRWQRLYGDEQR